MSHSKPRKYPISERNRVLWVDRDCQFKHEHSISYPRPTWFSVHKKIAIAGMLAFFVMVFLVFLIGYTPLKILFICVSSILLSLFIIDTYGAGMRTYKFYKGLLERGGKIIDPWNAAIIKRTGKTANIVTLMFLLLLYLYVVVLSLASIRGWFHIDFSSISFSLNIVNFLFICNAAGYSTDAFIFMDIDEGMLFGGALFSYQKLSGIRPAKRGSGFELYYEGKKIASGNMLPNDMQYLLDIIEIQNKYQDYLSQTPQSS